ncbi:vesicle-associated membrane protein-associated protein B-like isoform X2 [Ornithodoros turicata]|uniref:vesicle-associated membrane protein-associated protein B-like isoform X2 n=1 Tax=Ornithodoros turicata TaxID=34597 RepID=UPI003139C588
MSRQVLQLEPESELHFQGPFNDVVTSHLKLSNPTDRRICFKVKTTAPKRYCVRPNSGILEPRQSIQVAVMLQPFEYDPTEKNKHKFMVQTMFAPDGDVNQETVWRDVNPENLMDSKLRCVFEMPTDNAPQNNLDVSTSHGDDKMTVPKTVTEPAPKSPKAGTQETELKKLSEENKRLRDEVSHLRLENSNLKEEGLRQRMMRSTAPAEEYVSAQSAAEVAGARTQQPTKKAPAAVGGTSPLVLTVFAVAMLIVGVLVGKWLF